MKHVKEPLPGRAAAAPEISAALAAVVERATAKETSQPLPAVGEMVHDLEEVLASRPPAPARRAARPPPSCARSPATPPTSRPCACATRSGRFLTVLLLALVAVARSCTSPPDGEGAGRRPDRGPAAGTRARSSCASDAASDYDPEGDDGEESPEAENLVLDGLPNTGWDTETYQAGLRGGRQVRRGHLRGRRRADPRPAAGPDHLHARASRRPSTPPTPCRLDRRLDEGEQHREGEPRAAASSSTRPATSASATTSSGSRAPPDEGKATIQEIRLSQTSGLEPVPPLLLVRSSASASSRSSSSTYGIRSPRTASRRRSWR